MKSDFRWNDFLENEEELIQVLFDDGPLPEFPGDSTSQAGRLYQTLSVVHQLIRGDYEHAGNRISELSGSGQSFLCHQLALIWLQAEVEDARQAFDRMNEWFRISGVAADYKRSYRILLRQSTELDRRLASRWAPVLRLYLATLLDEWPPEVLALIEQDNQTARQNQVSPMILKRLAMMLRLARARQDRCVNAVVDCAAEWYQLCQEHPEYGNGCEFILEAAIALEFDNKADEALIWLDKALSAMPGHYEYLMTKARILKQDERFGESLAVCDELIRHYPDDFAGYCLRSNAWFLTGQYDRAMQDARRACDVAPDNPNSLMARAFVNMQLGRYHEALIDFRLTLQREPDAYDALRGEGKCLSMLGRDYEALSCFSRLRRMYPDDPDIYYEMADVLFSAGYLEDCEKACRRCLQIDDAYVNAYVILGMIAMRRNEDELAGGLLHRAVSMEPDNPFALNELAYLTHLQGDDDQALELVDRALAETPEYADAWCNKGMVLYYRSEFDLAATAFGQAISLAPEHVTAWIGRGNTLAQLCEFDEAQNCYDKALDIDPRSADACHGKALLYRMIGLDEEVRRWQERAVQLDPDIEDV